MKLCSLTMKSCCHLQRPTTVRPRWILQRTMNNRGRREQEEKINLWMMPRRTIKNTSTTPTRARCPTPTAPTMPQVLPQQLSVCSRLRPSNMSHQVHDAIGTSLHHSRSCERRPTISITLSATRPRRPSALRMGSVGLLMHQARGVVASKRRQCWVSETSYLV